MIEDITASMKGYTRQSHARRRRRPSQLNGKIYGVPLQHVAGRVLLQQGPLREGRRRRRQIKTWDDLLGAVKTIKAAGITPMVVGGADKWPLHFYWTHLAVRVGGKAGLRSGDEGRGQRLRRSETFVKSGELFKQLVDLKPFQTGFLGFKYPQAVGHFGDGKGAMIAHHQRPSTTRRRRSRRTSRASPTTSSAGSTSRSSPAARAIPTDTLGGINGWLVTKGSPKEAVDFLKFFVSKDAQTRLAAGNFFIPVYKGAEDGLQSRSCAISRRTWRSRSTIRTSMTRCLARRSARVVNDVSAEIAGGSMTPKEAAKAVQDAWKQGN